MANASVILEEWDRVALTDIKLIFDLTEKNINQCTKRDGASVTISFKVKKKSECK